MTEPNTRTSKRPHRSTPAAQTGETAPRGVGNRLAGEPSLYLRQHKDNPVNWLPWGEEAFALARTQGKPILLSIGYSACHWCHVMARESFEDGETAALMNARFVNVKVDREERPDIDALYMHALTAMGQRGGWPLTMFLTPEGKPFWGGTYFPPTPSRGLPAFRQLLVELSDFYQREHEAVVRNTSAVTAALEGAPRHGIADGIDGGLATQTAEALLEQVDSHAGGLGGAPKFPHAPIFRFLWNTWLRTGRTAFKDAVTRTLTAMSQGGIYDHLAGGYARYAVDEDWTVPHFEKMLYDNAQLVELLTAAWTATGEKLFADRARETVAWVLREMVTQSGAFAASLGAESEGEEGRYYVWAPAEIDAVLGDQAELFREVYGVTGQGHVGDFYVLHRTTTALDDATERRLADGRRRLLAARAERISPVRDDKVLADWNGLMMAALARAGCVFDEPDWLSAAARAFEFVAGAMDCDSRLCHAWISGRARGAGILDDYASMARAALILCESTGDPRYLEQAQNWTETVVASFGDDGGGFFTTPGDGSDMFIRLRHAEDDATPSGNGVMLEVLARLQAVTGKGRYGEAAERLSRAFAAAPAENLPRMATFIDAAQFLRRPVQVVIVGASSARDTAALRSVVYRSPCPDVVLATIAPGRDFPGDHPAHGKSQLGGRATAYVCVGQTCFAPTTEPKALTAALPGPADGD